MTSLRQRMLADMELRNYASGTKRLYVTRVARFAAHFGKCPSRLGAAEIKEYLHHLVESENVSWSYFNQAVCALRFFYQVTLQRPEMIPHLPFPRQEKRLPTVLSEEEVTRFFQAVSHPRDRVAGLTGRDWLEFLDGDAHHFTEGAGAGLATAPYAPGEPVDLDALLAICETWVRRNA